MCIRDRSCGMSAYVYLKNPSNLGVQETVADLLEEMRRDGRYGISEVLTREEAARREHLYGSFSFVIETDGTTTFGNRWTPPVSSPLTNSDYRFGLATQDVYKRQPQLRATSRRSRSARWRCCAWRRTRGRLSLSSAT